MCVCGVTEIPLHNTSIFSTSVMCVCVCAACRGVYVWRGVSVCRMCISAVVGVRLFATLPIGISDTTDFKALILPGAWISRTQAVYIPLTFVCFHFYACT